MSSDIERLFRQDAEGAVLTLLGSRCRNCGEVVFPALRDCPVCVQPDVMEPVGIPGHGRLRDYVIAERGPEGFEVPYVQSWVQLDDGPVVFSIVDTPDAAAFCGPRDTPVTLVERSFGSGEAGFHAWQCVVDPVSDHA